MLLPVYRAGLSHSKIVNDVERGNPVSPPQWASETVRHAVGGAGVRCRKKRRPSCNGTDTGRGGSITDITRPERELTSYAGAPLRKSMENLLEEGKQFGSGQKADWCALRARF